jgi:hypothetical protein
MQDSLTGEPFAVGVGTVTYLGLGSTYVGRPVCRFYIPPDEGDSHFFSASADECAVVHLRFPEFVLESNAAFYVTLPDPVTGVSPLAARSDFGSDYDIPLVPRLRLWNQPVDSNHQISEVFSNLNRPRVMSAENCESRFRIGSHDPFIFHG